MCLQLSDKTVMIYISVDIVVLRIPTGFDTTRSPVAVN